MSWLWSSRRPRKDEEESYSSGSCDEEEEEEWTSEEEEEDQDDEKEQDDRNNVHGNQKDLDDEADPAVNTTMPTGDDSGPEPRSSAAAAVRSLLSSPEAAPTVSSLEQEDDEDEEEEEDDDDDDEEEDQDAASCSDKITKVDRLHIPQAVEVLKEPMVVTAAATTTTTTTTTTATSTVTNAAETNLKHASTATSSSSSRMVGNRPRVDSAISSSSHSQQYHHDDDEEDNGNNDHHDEEEDEDEDDENEPGVHSTSLAEKQSLLLLAAEHDRVDILQAILTEDVRATLLAPLTAIPPLHMAVAYGSVHAVNGLLRMGADPSLRPNVPDIVQRAQEQGATPLERSTINSMARYDGRTAWELVFGTENKASSTTKTTTLSSPPPSSSLSLSSFSPSLLRRTSSSAVDTNTTVVVDLPPSKREGIRHAFTAEALRCIGSDDDARRLQQLLQAGMPATIDIGGKSLYDWAVEMSAALCEELLRPTEAAKYEPAEEREPDVADVADHRLSTPAAAAAAAVVHRPDSTELSGLSLIHLLNRLDELDSLARALSISLDALAEEASVCNGLLLMGGGAAALAAHVRSLKATQERKRAALIRLEEAWENAQDELAYWVREGGVDAQSMADTILTAPSSSSSSSSPSEQQQRRASLLASMQELTAAAEAGTLSEEQVTEQQAQLRRQVTAQIAASEHKICKLRASIADLSEVCARDLAQVEARGLAGGVTLVRGLREEIRDLEFALAEVQSAEATCRMKITRLQANVSNQPPTSNTTAAAVDTATGRTKIPDSVQPNESVPTTTRIQSSSTTATTANGITGRNGKDHLGDTPIRTAAALDSDQKTPDSQRIAAGQSTAIALRHGSGHQGFFPLSLWEIILRIIGLGEDRGTSSSSSSSSSSRHSQPVMIV